MPTDEVFSRLVQGQRLISLLNMLSKESITESIYRLDLRGPMRDLLGQTGGPDSIEDTNTPAEDRSSLRPFSRAAEYVLDREGVLVAVCADFPGGVVLIPRRQLLIQGNYFWEYFVTLISQTQ